MQTRTTCAKYGKSNVKFTQLKSEIVAPGKYPFSMGFVKAASDSFFSVCSTLALTVSTVTEWAAYILHANYVCVTKVYTSLCYTLNLLFTILDTILQAMFTILVYIFDFLAEIYACVCALLVLLWRICVLVYKVVCLLFTGVETVVVGLWSGGVHTYKTLQQSAIDVIDTFGSTTDYIALMAQDFVVYVFGVFTLIGNFSTAVVRGLWTGIGYVPATISYLPTYTADWMARFWMRFTMWVSFAFMGVTRETYFGIIICCISYVVVSKLVHILHNRGFTLFPFRRRRQRGSRQTANADLFPLDTGFESDIDDIDDFDDNNSADESDDDDNGDGDESDAHTELTLSDNDSDDNNSAGSESDVSLNSQTFTSEDSDQEIDVQLPANDDGYSLRSRASTPSRIAPKDMSHVDFEREIERERDKRMCVVCQDAHKSVLILPCKHMCLCVACANQIVRSHFAERRICPLCRTRIERVMNVYV